MAFSELAHAGERSKYRQTEIFRQVVPNMIKHTFETISWQASLVGYWCVTAHGVTIQQIYSQRIGQTFAVAISPLPMRAFDRLRCRSALRGTR